MKLTKEQIESRLAEIEKESAELRISLEKENEPWTPAVGCWIFSALGTVTAWSSSTNKFSRLGLERKTSGAADISLERMISSSLLQAYVHEHGGDWVADWNDEDQRKCSVVYCFNKKVWWYVKSLSILEAGTVYMNEECAEKLRDDLNSGRVVTNARMNLVPVK